MGVGRLSAHSETGGAQWGSFVALAFEWPFNAADLGADGDCSRRARTVPFDLTLPLAPSPPSSLRKIRRSDGFPCASPLKNDHSACSFCKDQPKLLPSPPTPKHNSIRRLTNPPAPPLTHTHFSFFLPLLWTMAAGLPH